MPERDVPAAPLGLARRAELEPERREPGVMEVDDERGQRDALLAEAVDAGLGDQPGALLHGREPEDRRRPGEEAADSVDRVVLRAHEELLALPEPAPDRRAQLRLELGSHVQEGGRPRPRVEVLVRAAHGEVGAARVQLHGDGAGGVAQVPEGQRARLAGGGRHAGRSSSRPVR